LLCSRRGLAIALIIFVAVAVVIIIIYWVYNEEVATFV
jgi:hypothetical protein